MWPTQVTDQMAQSAFAEMKARVIFRRHHVLVSFLSILGHCAVKFCLLYRYISDISSVFPVAMVVFWSGTALCCSFSKNVDDLPLFPLRDLVSLQGYCNLELCSTFPPLPYSHVSNPHFTYCFNYIIRFKNPLLGSPVKLHQVQACLYCFKMYH